MATTPRAPATDPSSNDVIPANGSDLYCLSYVSTQSRPMSNAELLRLLAHARESNSALGVSGLLLHRGDSFFQVLEGGIDEVQQLYARISADPRHKRIEVVTEGVVTEREYTEWQMAFIELDGQDLSAMPGFSDILKNTPAARQFLQGLSRSKKLALLFSMMD